MKRFSIQLFTAIFAISAGLAMHRAAAASDGPSFDDKTLYQMGDIIKHVTPVTPKNSELSYKLLRASADMGNVSAMGQLGEMYIGGRAPLEKGQDTNQEAIKWWNKAWELGGARGYHNLGLLYYGVPVPGADGRGVGVVKQDYAKAFQYFKAAADKGDTKAIRYVGICYEHGQGVKQDYAEAAKYYAKLDEGYFLAGLLLEGKGVQQDVPGAINMYEENAAAERGGSSDLDSAEALGRIYEEGRFVKADQNKAVEYYAKAVEFGSKTAKVKLTDFAKRLYTEGHALLKAGKYEAAFPLLMKSANLGNPDALKLTGLTKAEKGRNVVAAH